MADAPRAQPRPLTRIPPQGPATQPPVAGPQARPAAPPLRIKTAAPAARAPLSARPPAPSMPARHAGLELVTFSLLVAAGVFSLVGAALGTVGAGALFAGALVGLALAILATAGAAVCAHTLDHWHRFGQATGMGDEYTHLRQAGRLRITALMLHILTITALVMLGFAFAARVGLIGTPTLVGILERGSLALVAVIAVVQAVATFTSLQSARREGQAAGGVLLTLAVTIAAALSLLAVALLGRPEGASGLVAGDGAFVLVGASVASARALVVARALPPLAVILGSDRGLEGGQALNRNRSVVLPLVAAFALLMLVFLLFVLFGLGIVGTFTEVARDPILLGSFVFLVAALAGSVYAAVNLARSEPLEAKLFEVGLDAQKKREQLIMAGSGLGALLLLIPGFILFSGVPFAGLPTNAWIHFLCLAILVAVGPYGFYAAYEHKRVRLLEERFPDFLRDLASSHKGGLTLSNSLIVASRGDYGALTADIRKMADQVSWNVSFQEVLERFAERVHTPLILRAVALILEADRSGGATTEVLLAAARDAREIKALETDRRLQMSLYTIVIYVTFFVFLGIAAVLYSEFVPQLIASNQAVAEAGNSGVSGLGGSQLRIEDFQLFYLLAAVIQGLGDGIVAGMMGAGKARLGLRHSFLMVAVSYVTFALFLR